MSKPNLNSSQDEKYAAINTALNNYFFRGRFEMLPVYLDLEGEVVFELASAFDIDSNKLGDFIGRCAARSLQFDKTNPYNEQEKWLKEWSKTGRQTPPPFTALLCALSIAAERMGADEDFSPNNYYKRLCGLFDVKGEKNQRKLSQYGKSTRKFWEALNLWLIENDFMLGRPTAQALIPHWKYVSYALSQALVRDVDRKKFESLFETHHLLPDEPIPKAEMVLLIYDWMTNRGPAGPTAWLRTLWEAGSIRDRVVTAAIDALETWKSPTHVLSEGPRNAQFRWLLNFTSFPIERIELSLSIMRRGQEESLQQSTASTHAETGLLLNRGSDPDILVLEPRKSINLDLLLLQSREFIGDKSSISYNYVAKSIIPLALSSDGITYREVSRVSLFDEHIILCHGNWLKKIEGHLSKCARPGYKVFGPLDMQGIPKNWYIFREVEIIRSDENADENLYALNPIDGGAAIACVNGLDLGHNTWHADARPTLKVTTEKPNCTLKITKEQFDVTNEVLGLSKITSDFMEFPLTLLEISPRTNLRAVMVKSNNTIAETSFSLRSSDMPRRLDKKRIFHPIMENERFSLEVKYVSSDTQNGLEGCFFHGDVGELDTKVKNNFTDGKSEIPGGIHEIFPESEWQHSQDAAQKAEDSCVIRGHHVWVVESYEKGDDRFEAKKAECKHCHAKTLSRSRKEARKNWIKMSQPDQVSMRIVQEEKQEGEEKTETDQTKTDFIGNTPISPDTTYDGLCYLGQGTWKEFQRIVSKISQEPWFSYSFAHHLFTLGHLEIQNAFHSTASEWSVPPPVLVISQNNESYLAGFHSKILLENIDAALTQKGARRESISTPEQVTMHRWVGLAGLDVEVLLKDIKDPHDRSLAVTRNLDRVIASKLPTLDKILECGTPMHVERPDGLARFDVHQARWIHADTLQEPGAYRVGLHGIRYAYHDANGATRQVGYRVAKILAARAKNMQLHKYDSTTCQFIATLGADPPGLFARALIVSSGMLPKIEHGRLTYTNVDPRVATLILSKMYGMEKRYE